MTCSSKPSASASTDRRRVLKLSLLGSLTALTPTLASAAQEPVQARPPMPAPAAPVVDARFPAEVAPGVFVLPDKRIPLVPNIGIVVGRDAVLVVDCGLGIESAEGVLSLARGLAPGRRVVLTVTHAHPEHGFGAQVFKGQGRITYNRAQAEYFARSGSTLLDGFRATVLRPEHKYLLDGVAITPPDDTYDGAVATLDLGGRVVEFRTWGTAHSPGDQIVHLPDERIVFAGDLLEERMFPIVPLFPPMITRADMDIARWEAVLGDILRLQPRLIVPGHGNLGGAEIATDVLAYFQDVRALVQASEGPAEDLAALIRARYPTWENSHFVAPTVRYFSEQPG